MASIPEPYREWHAGSACATSASPPSGSATTSSTAPPARPPSAPRWSATCARRSKLRVRLALASQRLEDFGGALAELANRYWILGAGGKAREEETLAGLFALNETLSDAVRYRLTGTGEATGRRRC